MMEDILTLIKSGKDHAPAVAIYLGDLLSRGVTSGIGKDIWDRFKQLTSNPVHKKAAEAFEQEPNDSRNRIKIEFILEGYLLENTEFRKTILRIIQDFESVKEKLDINIVNSKNVLSNSYINLNSGNVHIGDKS